jgi:hypothetical protein
LGWNLIFSTSSLSSASARLDIHDLPFNRIFSRESSFRLDELANRCLKVPV